MNLPRSLHSLALLLAAGLLLGDAAPAAARYGPAAADSTRAGTPDEEVPYGVASGWIVGHKLLQEGNTAEALPYLHMAYRAQPEVVDIALDFQAALAAEGYVKDALEVMDLLVVSHPDSAGFLVRRANLHLKAGRADDALADLRVLRDQGQVDFALVDAEAQILAATGQIDQALDVYRDGLHLLPERGPDIYLGMSGVLQKAERDAMIPELMDEAVQRHPDVPRLWLVKLRVLAALSRDDEALAAARAADTHFASRTLEAVSDSTVTLPSDLPPDSFVVELADFHAKRRAPEKAVAILEPMSDAGELDLTPNLWLARLLLGTGRAEDGAALVSRIIDQWPDSGRAWFLRGKAAEGRGEWPASLPAFRRAVELAPRDPEVRLGYLRAMLVAWEGDLVTGDPDADQEQRQTEFRDHLMAGSTLVPDADHGGQLILGYGFKAMRDYERATWRFGLAAESEELRLNALMQKSICHDLLGEEAKARKALERLHQDYPRHPEVANSLGYFLAEKGVDLDFASELLAIALEAEPGNGAYLDSKGWILYRQGDLEGALDFMIRAVNVLPDDPVILEHLGMVLRGQGKGREALDVMRRALSAGGDRERLAPLIEELEAEQP